MMSRRFVGLNTGVEIKEQSQSMIHIVFVTRTFSLVNIHIPKIITPFRAYGLFDSDTQSILVKSV